MPADRRDRGSDPGGARWTGQRFPHQLGLAAAVGSRADHRGRPRAAACAWLQRLRGTTPAMTSRVLYLICCAAPPALRAEELVVRAQARGWDVCLICTPTAARWLQAKLPALANLTRHPVRSQYKLPDEPDLLPPPDAMLVAPATANTIT